MCALRRAQNLLSATDYSAVSSAAMDRCSTVQQGIARTQMDCMQQSELHVSRDLFCCRFDVVDGRHLHAPCMKEGALQLRALRLVGPWSALPLVDGEFLTARSSDAYMAGSPLRATLTVLMIPC
jgi:hypothetical protein